MKNCLFCKIVNHEVDARIVFEDERVLAFEDIDPKAPVHVLIIPKKHYATLLDVPEEESDLMWHILKVARGVARIKRVADRGFRIVSNCNPESGQSVYHLHFHVLGGRQMQWPPG